LKYAIDTEFIDTPNCSELISLAIVREDGAYRYFEFDFGYGNVTPWLHRNVLPHLTGEVYNRADAANEILTFIADDVPEIWAYYASHDWYFFCRLFGGLMELPRHWPGRPREFADFQQGIPDTHGPAHNALNDAQALMHAMLKKPPKRILPN
jgi:hypothetical protein